MWDQVAPCSTSYEAVPPTQKALAQLGQGATATPSLASTVGSVSLDTLKEGIAGLQEVTSDLETKLDQLVNLIEEEEDTRSIKLQHLSGMKVEGLSKRTNESLASTDEAVEEAQVQLERLSLLEDQNQSLIGEEVDDIMLKESLASQEVTGKEAEGAKGTKPKKPVGALGAKFFSQEEVVRRQHLLAAEGAVQGQIPSEGSVQYQKDKEIDHNILAHMHSLSTSRTRTPSTTPLAGSPRFADQGPLSAPPYGPPPSRISTAASALKTGHAEPVAQHQEEVGSQIPEEDCRIQGMVEAIELRAQSLELGVKQQEVQGRSMPGWTAARRKEILELELETSKVMLNIEDYAKVQTAMTEDVYEAEAEKLRAGFLNKAALLRRRVNNITAQDNAELLALSAERRNLSGTESTGQKNSALPPHPNQLFSSPAPNKDISRYKEVSQDHLQVSGNARGGSNAEFPASAQASQPQQHPEGSRISPSPHHFHLPRAELPKFTGKLTDWPEFYRCFRAMADHQYSPPIYLMQLKSKLTKEGQNLLAGVTDVDQAWEVLQGYFGDHQMMIATVIEELLATKLSSPSQHKNLEQLCQAVQAAISALKTVGGEEYLQHDQRLVAALVSKLPSSSCQEWDRFNAYNHPHGLATWNKFIRWIWRKGGEA